MVKIVYSPTFTISQGERPPAELLTQIDGYHYSALEVYPASPDATAPTVALIMIRTVSGFNETVAGIALDHAGVAALTGALQQAFDAAPQKRKE